MNRPDAILAGEHLLGWLGKRSRPDCVFDEALGSLLESARGGRVADPDALIHGAALLDWVTVLDTPGGQHDVDALALLLDLARNRRDRLVTGRTIGKPH
jgi:hypothetical protein